MIDIESTIISQYANSPTLVKLVQNMNEYIKPDADIENFYSFIWNVDTAQGFGLDIWGRIVNISREVFTNPVYYLSDDDYRSLIFLKALSNITAATNPAINQLLRNWIGSRGKTYVSDLGGMMIRYNFEFELKPFEIVIVQKSGIFLRPSGVGATLIQSEYPVFGFNEMGTTWAAPFGQKPFLAEDAVNAAN